MKSLVVFAIFVSVAAAAEKNAGAQAKRQTVPYNGGGGVTHSSAQQTPRPVASDGVPVAAYQPNYVPVCVVQPAYQPPNPEQYAAVFQPSRYPAAYQPQYPAVVAYQPAQYPAAAYRPAQYPAAAYRPAQYPAAAYQPAQYPAAAYQPAQYPAATYQPAQYSAAAYQPPQDAQPATAPYSYSYFTSNVADAAADNVNGASGGNASPLSGKK